MMALRLAKAKGTLSHSDFSYVFEVRSYSEKVREALEQMI
jgi:hypothetical protein